MKNEENEMIVLYAPWCPFCQAMEGSFTESAQTYGKAKNVRYSKFRADQDEKEWSKENLSLSSFPTILFFPKGREGFVKLGGERRRRGFSADFHRVHHRQVKANITKRI